jgi:hypothetical protein
MSAQNILPGKPSVKARYRVKSRQVLSVQKFLEELLPVRYLLTTKETRNMKKISM